MSLHGREKSLSMKTVMSEKLRLVSLLIPPAAKRLRVIKLIQLSFWALESSTIWVYRDDRHIFPSPSLKPVTQILGCLFRLDANHGSFRACYRTIKAPSNRVWIPQFTRNFYKSYKLWNRISYTGMIEKWFLSHIENLRHAPRTQKYHSKCGLMV